MRSFAVVSALALFISACGEGISAETTEDRPAEELTTTTANATTTTVAPTTTTAAPVTTSTTTTSTTMPPSTSTTEALPDFPPGRENLEHGGDTWVVILAVATEPSDPLLASGALDAEAAGYTTGITDCDFGVVEALGLPEDEHYYSVSVYLENEADANQARDAFEARGLDATVAQVQTFCLD